MKYGELRQHIGHAIVCVTYGAKDAEPDNIAVECETCMAVLLDYDRPNRTGYCTPCEATQYMDDDSECIVCGTVCAGKIKP